MAFLGVASRTVFAIASVAALTGACGSRSSDESTYVGAAGIEQGAGGTSFAGAFGHGGSAFSTGGTAATNGGTVSSAGDGSTLGGSASGGTGNSGGIGLAGSTASAGAAGGGSSIGGGSLGGSGGVGGQAGASTGGTAAGGTSGSAGRGGTGGGTAACPRSAPIATGNALVACSTPNQICSYTGERCTCQRQARGGGSLAWACVGSGAACPSGEPADNSTCPGNLVCPYPNGDQCNCQQAQWNCFTPGCPSSKPAPGSNCGGVAGQCRYGSSGACVCVGGGWFCN